MPKPSGGPMASLKSSRIRKAACGACIVGAHAGELIFPWALAVEKRMKVGAFAGAIAPYPTISEVSKRATGTFYTPSLFSDRRRRRSFGS